jgi:hypothetical protein
MLWTNYSAFSAVYNKKTGEAAKKNNCLKKRRSLQATHLTSPAKKVFFSMPAGALPAVKQAAQAQNAL